MDKVDMECIMDGYYGVQYGWIRWTWSAVWMDKVNMECSMDG